MRIVEFTKRVWKQHNTSLVKRAGYLRSLFNSFQRIKDKYRYLDVGCGSSENALCFGDGFKETHCLDVVFRGRIKKSANCFFSLGDARALPFRDETFDLISIISVIEHLQNYCLAVTEACRVVKNGGMIILQVPNRQFPVDLHTGLPLLHYLPSSFRRSVLRKLGYEKVSDVIDIEVPSYFKVIKTLKNLDNYKDQVRVSRVVYPSELILPFFRPIYSLMKFLRILSVVPLGWLFVFKKKNDGC